MARQRHPKFSEEELRVMVEEIVRVEPQLFGSQVQHTSIARKMELWRRIVDWVNAVGQHPRNREDIRKRWNDLQGKVRSVVSRHHLAVQRTGGGPPPPPPQLTTWEEQVLAILHPEGLAGVGGGMDSGKSNLNFYIPHSTCMLSHAPTLALTPITPTPLKCTNITNLPSQHQALHATTKHGHPSLKHAHCTYPYNSLNHHHTRSHTGMLALGYTVTHPLHTMIHTDAIIMPFHPCRTTTNVTRQEGPDMSTPPTEEAHSDDSSSVQLDLVDQPGPSGTSGQSQATTDLPPSGNTSTAPTQQAHTSVPRTRQSAVCPPLQGTQDNPPPQQQQGPGGSGSGHTVQGTEAQEHRGTGRTAVRQGEDRPREPTLHKALSSIMGAYHHSQETVATVLAKFQETQCMQKEQYMGFREELRTISSTLGTIVGVLKELLNTRRDTVALQGAPDTSMDNELATTSAGACEQNAPPQDHHTSTPPPADGEPPRKRSLRSRNKTEHDAKTPAKK
ncbi:hypothetical protein NDU88_003914 [Pleurodeles waltl]|uniref:Myb/SANT-like DNA-binding domain-containing protein n=1 Tax=Pleurodeles waltl TaxID=8319 RepID=A0AAV7NI36_PLEWA|nr:hypothetical protein NDU88_003914 [Pleurodeles waltl]